MRDKAIKLLGKYATDQRGNKNLSDRRINKFMYFLKKNEEKCVKIKINNHWGFPPIEKSLLDFERIGCYMNIYTIWAIVEKS